MCFCNSRLSSSDTAEGKHFTHIKGNNPLNHVFEKGAFGRLISLPHLSRIFTDVLFFSPPQGKP